MYQDDVFETKLQDVKNMLIEYVKDEADEVTVTSSGDVNFRCVNPDHADNNPSMFVGQNMPHIAYCRSCKSIYNIFQVHNIFHQAPLHGLGFIKDNVNQLAVKYDVEPVDMSDITEEQLFKMMAQQIHDAAANILGAVDDSKYQDIVTHDYARQLMISDEILKQQKIGTIKNRDLFYQAIMKTGGWSLEDLENVGLKNWLFNPTQITYTIFNPHGSAVAFASRNLDKDGRFGVTINPNQKRKWINSTISTIYNKTDCLYGYSVAKKTKEKTIYVFEGYTDVCVAYTYGIFNAVCVGGTAFGPEHVKMLSDAGFTICIISMDNDDAGLGAAESVLKKGFNQINDMKPQVLEVPPTPKQDGSDKFDHDPDSYIHLYGPDAFKALKPKTAFRFTIDRLPDTLDDADKKAEFLQRFLPLISAETNAVTRDQMQYDISQRIKVPVTTVKESLARREEQFNIENRNLIKKEYKKFTAKFYDSVELNPDQLTEVVYEFSEFVNSKMDAEHIKAIGLGEVQEGLENWWENVQESVLDTVFWKTGWTFWDNTFGGIKKTGNFTGITAPSNVGKSAFLMNLALRIMQNNDHDELLLLYWTIDDPRSDVLTKMAAINCNLPISKVSDYQNLKPTQQKDIQAYVQSMKKWIERDRCFVIKDMSIGNGAQDLTRWVEAEREKQPHKKVLVFIDNFANMSYTGDELSGQIRNIDMLHKLRVQNDIALVSSFEVNKQGTSEKSGANSVYGSGKIQYRLTLNLSLWNEVDVIKSQKLNKTPKMFWVDKHQEQRPIVNFSIIKKKMTFKDDSFGGDIWFRFVNNIGTLNEIGGKSAWDQFQTENASFQHLGLEWNFQQPGSQRYLQSPLTSSSDSQNNEPDENDDPPLPTVSPSDIKEL